MSKERFFKGTFLLTSAGLISRIMGFFYRIFLSHTIGAEGIGLYQLVVPLQHLVLAMTTFGIQTALSRLISSHTALGEKKEAQDCFRIGTFLALFLSGIAAWSIFTFSDFFAVQILKEPATESLIRLLALSFPFASVHLCVNSYYLGLKKASFPAATQILETGRPYFFHLPALADLSFPQYCCHRNDCSCRKFSLRTCRCSVFFYLCKSEQFCIFTSYRKTCAKNI